MAKVKPEYEDSPKREAILHAALELFAEYGYHGTTVPQVADRAKVGAGTVYRYFDSKEALVNALFQKWKSALGRTLMEDFPMALPVRAKFAELWRRLAQFGTQQPVAFAFLELHHHGSYLDKRSLEVEEALLLPIRAFAAEAQRTGEIKPLAPEMLGALVFGSFTGLVLAQRKGLLSLTPKTIHAAEQCMWEAIRR